MSDSNLDIIQNKIDALVDKIIQKENSDEDFRITYAQILEKINTKIDVFSGTENLEKLAFISMEIRDAISKRQEIVDGKFAAIKSEFDRVNEILINSFHSKDVVAAYERIDEMIEKQEAENKEKHEEIIKFIEGFNALEETNDSIKTNFAIVKEQNTIASENFAKQIDALKDCNKLIEDCNEKTMKNFETVLYTLQEFADTLNEDFENVKEFISEKTISTIDKIHETDSFLELLNNNLSTLIQVVGTIFENQEFVDLQSDVTDILTKIAYLTEALKEVSKKDDVKELINDLTNTLSETKDILSEEITDTISAESVALSGQIDSINKNVDSVKENIDGVKENVDSVKENVDKVKDNVDSIKENIETTKESLEGKLSQLDATLDEMQSKFATQLIQVADNISFEDEFFEVNESLQECSDELKQKISADFENLKQELAQIRELSGASNENILSSLEKIDDSIRTDLNNDLKALSSGFRILSSGLKEEKDYVYTLPDIEADLSKIRLNLNKIQNSILKTDAETVEAGEDIASKINNIKEALEKLQNSSQDADIAEIKSLFTSLNEDVSSISKRTNKLILSSDEVSKTLHNNILTFTSLMRAFEKQSREFYDSAMLRDMSKKVSNVEQSNNILNEAFMYLAEWIDSASETFEELTNDITVIRERVQAPEEESEKLSRNLKSLSIKVEEQDSKIEEIEDKLDSIDEKLNKIIAFQNDSKETKSLLEYVASQISVANEKIIENEKLALKMASMDKQLKKIEKNIAIITEYIDDEDADDEDYDSED